MKHLFIKDNTKPVSLASKIVNITIVTIILLWSLLSALTSLQLQFDFSFIIEYWPRIQDGFLLTIMISICSLILSILIGSITALMLQSKIIIINYFASFYVKCIRGTPLIMQIYLFYYIIATALGLENRFVAGVVILSIFEGAYICEIIRGSYLSLEKGQLLAAKAVGFSTLQTFRLVILPQLVSRTLPALTGQFASIIKDSSLLSIISVIEITQTMKEISASNFKLFETYFFLGILYLCLTLPVSYFSKKLERKFDYGNPM